MECYSVLETQKFNKDVFSLVPIRLMDRYDILKWRNEQLFHLRQSKLLTKDDQDRYFEEVVKNLFKDKQPNQILFSFLVDNVCKGYGGLVHINWFDKNAEISFLIDTSLENDLFCLYWTTYLGLIEQVAFEELGLHKIYTYAYDVRPKLYSVLEAAGYNKEATLVEHCSFDGKFVDVVIHSKIISNIFYDKVSRRI